MNDNSTQRRREPRIGLSLPVHIWGADSEGHRFEQDAIATNISTRGALLLAIGQRIRCGDLVGIAYQRRKARFRVVWTQDSEAQHVKVAVQRLESEHCPWKELLCTEASRVLEQDALLSHADEQIQTGASLLAADVSANEKSYTHARRWRRHKVDVPIRVIVHGPNKTSLYDGRGNELSEGGMALTAGVELQPGDVVDIEFTPPYSGSPIRSKGTVRNRTGYRYGIEFLATSDQDAERSDRLLTMLTSM